VRYLILLLALAACATPETILKNHDSYVSCGGSSVGSVAGGMIGYGIQKEHDLQCVADYKAQGYVIIKHLDEK
jgi:hypothetical protein